MCEGCHDDCLQCDTPNSRLKCTICMDSTKFLNLEADTDYG